MTKPRTPRKLRNGIYTGTIASVKAGQNPNQLILTLSIDKKPPDIAPGMIKYNVYHTQLGKYTSIGAKNIHHACNKATKLFKGNFTGITSNDGFHYNKRYEFLSVAEFNRAIKET